MKIFYKIILLFCFVMLMQSELSAQPSITWQRTYGGTNIDYGYSIVQTPDEGFIAVGRKRIITTNYAFAMRLNKFGDTIWVKTFSGITANQIERTSDGNYIIAIDGNLIKINIDGDILWMHPESAGAKLRETSNKGFALCLSAENGPFLFYPKLKRADSLGNLLWEKTFTDGFTQGRFSDITINSKGEYIMSGSCDNERLFIMKTDSAGNTIWIKKYDTWFIGKSIIAVNDSNYILGGDDNFYGRGAFLFMFNDQGDSVWYKDYSDGRTRLSICSSVINTLDGGFAFTGTYDLRNYDFYVRLNKTDSEGNLTWQNLYGFNNSDEGMNVRQTTDSGYVIVGLRENYHLGDIYIIKTDKNGYANPPVSISNNSEILPDQFELFQNYPNPFNPTTTIAFSISKSAFIRIKIYDVTGKEINILVNENKQPGVYKIKFDGSNLSSGIYYFSLFQDNVILSTKKMMILK